MKVLLANSHKNWFFYANMKGWQLKMQLAYNKTLVIKFKTMPAERFETN